MVLSLFNEPLKLLISYWVFNGCKLYNVQHQCKSFGSSTSQFLPFLDQNFHINILLGGWKNKSSKIIRLPSLRIYSRVKDIYSSKNKKYDIIFFSKRKF